MKNRHVDEPMVGSVTCACPEIAQVSDPDGSVSQAEMLELITLMLLQFS